MIRVTPPVIEATAESRSPACASCGNCKGAPLAADVVLGDLVAFSLCEECGRDLANAVGFMCIRDGGWSKLKPKKRKVRR